MNSLTGSRPCSWHLDELSYGEAQEAGIVLARETYPGKLNVAFTRGFVSSQAFVDRYVTDHDGLETLIPDKAGDGLDFVASHPKAEEALAWMGFEAQDRDSGTARPGHSRQDRAGSRGLLRPQRSGRRLAAGKTKKRLFIIIDNSKDHKPDDSGKSQSADRLAVTAGADQVKRQHMSNLQHNKTIVVDGRDVKAAICGSTNFT